MGFNPSYLCNFAWPFVFGRSFPFVGFSWVCSHLTNFIQPGSKKALAFIWMSLFVLIYVNPNLLLLKYFWISLHLVTSILILKFTSLSIFVLSLFPSLIILRNISSMGYIHLRLPNMESKFLVFGSIFKSIKCFKHATEIFLVISFNQIKTKMQNHIKYKTLFIAPTSTKQETLHVVHAKTYHTSSYR